MAVHVPYACPCLYQLLLARCCAPAGVGTQAVLTGKDGLETFRLELVICPHVSHIL